MRTTDRPAEAASCEGDEERGPDPDRATLLGAAVSLLAVGALAAVLSAALLVGALQIAAAVLAALGAGALVLCLPWPRLLQRRRALAVAVVLVLGLALIVPAILSHRPDRVRDLPGPEIAALGTGDRATTIPDPATDSPILIRRADGPAELLGGSPLRRTPIPADAEDSVVLSADGDRLVQEHAGTTTVRSLDEDLGLGEPATFPGRPLALVGSVLVVTDCEGEECWQSGYDLSSPAEKGEEPVASWNVQVDPDAPGTATPGAELDLTQDQPSPAETLRSTGVLPGLALRWDHEDGWTQIDPATGFPEGNRIGGPDCAVLADEIPVGRRGVDPGPAALSICPAAGGALSVRATRHGEQLWQVGDSEPGDWTVRAEQGRVIAAGTTAEGRSGEILAAERDGQWTPLGGDLSEQVSGASLRLASGGGEQILVTSRGQLLGVDTASGADLWLAAIQSPGSSRAVLGGGDLVVLDHRPREHALDPRDAWRLRVFSSATGGKRGEITLAKQPQAVPLGAGRVLLDDGDGARLLRTG